MYNDTQQARYNEYQALRDKYRPYLRDYVERHLQKAHGKQYICPLCGKPKFTLSKKQEGLWTCYSNNHDKQILKTGGYSGDIFELVGAIHGLDTKRDFVKIIEKLGQEFGDMTEPKHKQDIQLEQKPLKDQTANYKKWAAALPDFVAGKEYRGLSMETLKHFVIGCNHHPKNGDSLIIPTDKYNYSIRLLNPPEKGERYLLPAGTKKEPFNKKAFFSDVLSGDVSGLIVEGEFDCMSVYEIDSRIPCIATRSGGEGVILDTLRAFKEKGQTPKKPLIICMDKDDAGEGHTRAIKEGLEELGIKYYVYQWENVPYKDVKDFNDFLQADRERFRMTVYSLATKYTEPPAEPQEEAEKMETTPPAEQPKKESTFVKASEAAAHLWEDIESGKEKTVYPTGIKQLDKVLGGGLFEGLYVVGGEPGKGKTALCMQIAENVAKTQPVLFFTYEMTAHQLTAKSLCRLCCGIDKGFKASSLSLQGYGEPPTSKDRETIQKAVAEFYKGIGQKLYITEAFVDAGGIAKKVHEFITETGRRPVVVVDYLQVIPGIDGQDTKGRVSDAVTTIAEIYRTEHIPVLLVSALARDKSGKITLQSFRDTSTIEYHGTVCIGLEDNTDTPMDTDGRPVNLLILKNKQGMRPKDPIHLVFNGTAQTFTESKSNRIPGTEIKGREKKDVIETMEPPLLKLS